ncbi:MAG: head GIN domain-containing protein [Acidobacteriota bacterium]
MKNWILPALLIVSCSVACNLANKSGSQSAPASGVTKTDSRNIVGFTKIKAENAIELSVAVTNGYSIVIKGDESVLPSVVTELQGDTLVISLKDKTVSRSRINVSVTLPELSALELIGATHATVKGVKSDELKVAATGASSAEIEGQTRDLKINAIGASSVNAEGLKADKADVEAVGASKITVSVSDELKADATGASSVTYTGEPKSLKQNTSDVSTINKK